MNGQGDVICVRCNKNALFKCGRCIVPYCSATCQVLHCPFHRTSCFSMPLLNISHAMPSTSYIQNVPLTLQASISGEQQRSVPRRSLNPVGPTATVDLDNLPNGKVVYFTPKNPMPSREFAPHDCGVGCLHEDRNLSSYSSLAKPLVSGWERNVIQENSQQIVVCCTPCGRSLRNMSELQIYLRATSCSLNVDNFDFDCSTRCLAEYVIGSCTVQTKDLSNGSEPIAVPCVNYYDHTMPSLFTYSSKRVLEGVNLNLDDNFLCGCDCEDNCMDKTKCQCWKLTLEGASNGDPNTPSDQVGYQFKRLLSPVPTGIYECNSRCKCTKSCLNRVVQDDLQIKLQVFKTAFIGWGVRCLSDIPKGSFICVFAGELLNEEAASIAADDHGDQYFAELDYVEFVESLKEGYEADVLDDDGDDDDDGALSNNKNKVDEGQKNPSNRYKPIRVYYGENEKPYIIDARYSGNIGRHFNHSCSPNLFVQNVFVDTHDLRFPWVAFFTSTYIRAGCELTWNYNYDVDSVQGQVIYCKCGAENCRGRLL